MKNDTHTYSQLQIGWHRNLEIISETFNFVPGVSGFSWDLLLVPRYYLILIVNPMGRIVLREQSFRNNLKILCHPICKSAVYAPEVRFTNCTSRACKSRSLSCYKRVYAQYMGYMRVCAVYGIQKSMRSIWDKEYVCSICAVYGIQKSMRSIWDTRVCAQYIRCIWDTRVYA